MSQVSSMVPYLKAATMEVGLRNRPSSRPLAGPIAVNVSSGVEAARTEVLDHADAAPTSTVQVGAPTAVVRPTVAVP